VRASEREAIENAEPVRSGRSIIVPVNLTYECAELRAVKLGEGLRGIFGARHGDGAVVAKALCFSEPQYDLSLANDYALRWGFIPEPLVEATT